MAPLRLGDPAPWVRATTSTRRDFRFSSVAGRYVVMAFVSASRSPGGVACLQALKAARRFFDDSQVAFFGVTTDPTDQDALTVKDDLPGVRWFYDSDRAITRAFGLADGADGAWLLLDPMLRVMQAAASPDPILAMLPGLPALGHHAGCELTAPVLVLGRVFEPGLCTALIDYYRRKGGEESGFMVERNGRTTLALDPLLKRRADCHIEDKALRQACQIRIRKRLVPEIAKCFQFKATRMERYIVACYRGDEAGRFAPHRDNTTSGTAHRRFAVTLNLNAEDYEGGELRFPEFGPRTYRAPTGGAVVFSCSLQHEALPVRKGTRYVFLPFLYDESAAAQREANNRYLDETVQAYRA